MMTGKTEEENGSGADGLTLSNRKLLQGLCSQDGGMVSPIDLSMTSTKQLQLEPLRWVNFDIPPFRMKLTNSGDTLVISAKWAKERPYLTGGPLDGNYVFSQIHFHWGASEHEGSEHTVNGVCFPMEMHVVFFKTRYLTQAAALKQDDGIVILAYLYRLQTRSAPGLHWLASQLTSVVEPRTSSQVPPMPLNTLLVPFDSDYVTYWGALVSQNCRHPVLWLVSRAALAISADDLVLFRSLLNSKKEKMIKNFRVTSPSGGRAIFHVNPSTELKHLLLPGAIDPPFQAVVVNFSQMPTLNETQALKMFDKGDNNELQAKVSKEKKLKEQAPKIKAPFSLDTNIKKTTMSETTQPVSGFTDPENSGVLKPDSPCSENSVKKGDRVGTKLQRQCTVTKRHLNMSVRKNNNSELQEEKGDNVNTTPAATETSEKSSTEGNTTPNTKSKETTRPNSRNKDTLSKTTTRPVEPTRRASARDREATAKAKEIKNDEKPSQKSRLPVPKANARKGKPGLESKYASYFKRPDSAPSEQAKPATTSPRPSTRTGGN